MSKKDSINIHADGNISNISGIVSGNISGVVNLGQISGNVSNTINQLPHQIYPTQTNLRQLLIQLQSLIETTTELTEEDKIEALEQVVILAEAGQTPNEPDLQKLARTALKILKGTVVSMPKSSEFYLEVNKLLPQIKNEIPTHQPKVVNQDASTKTILFLAANPRNTSTLRLDEEVRELQRSLERSKNRELFSIQQRWAVTPIEIHRALLDTNPQIVHFSGHGMRSEQFNDHSDISSRSLDIDSDTKQGPEGLMFEDETGQSKLVSGEALANLFKLFSNHIECVVLNSCYSEIQANVISQYIPYVVGMKRAISDQAAIKFTTGFYDAILADKSIDFAYQLGCSAIHIADIPEHLTPVLKTKNA